MMCGAIQSGPKLLVLAFFFFLKLVELGSLPSKWEPARLQSQKKIKKGNTFGKQNRFHSEIIEFTL